MCPKTKKIHIQLCIIVNKPIELEHWKKLMFDICGNQPSAMGRLSIIDALLVKRNNIESSLSMNDFLVVAFILSQYRQYNEALSLIVDKFPNEHIQRFYSWMKISNSGKRSFLKFRRM